MAMRYDCKNRDGRETLRMKESVCFQPCVLRRIMCKYRWSLTYVFIARNAKTRTKSQHAMCMHQFHRWAKGLCALRGWGICGLGLGTVEYAP